MLKADARNGILVWQVTGPLALRTKGFKDIGYYGTQSYEGIVTHSRQVLRLGMRYWFLPRYCMLQWRHSGLVNSLSHNAGRTEVRLEGIFVG